MPKYSFKIDELLFEEEVRNMYNRADSEVKRVLLSLLWITGARPTEVIMLKREDIRFNQDKLEITLKTLKLGGDGQKFIVRDRTLVFDRPREIEANIYLETIVDYVKMIPPETRVIKYTTRWAEKVVNRLSEMTLGKKLSPYHFRHSVMTWLARHGASIDQLMYFKGARSYDSVKPYIHAKPTVVQLQNLRRERSNLTISDGERFKQAICGWDLQVDIKTEQKPNILDKKSEQEEPKEDTEQKGNILNRIFGTPAKKTEGEK